MAGECCIATAAQQNDTDIVHAHLIAAAPQLLEALQRIDLAPLSHGDRAFIEMQRIARAAIASATGKGQP